MNILVTGSNGFIGSHLVRKLISEGHHVKAMVLPGTSLQHLQNCDVEIVYADVTDPTTLAGIAAHTELIYHLAALPSLAWSQRVYEVNLHGTQNLLREAVNSRVKRVVYMSSLVVHGFQQFEEADESTPLLQPDFFTHPYIRSKIHAERVVGTYRQQVETVMVRPGFFIFGPYDMLTTKPTLDRIADNRLLAYLNGGSNKLGYVYIDNLVSGLVCAGTHPRAAGNTYIVADYDPAFITLHQFFDRLITGMRMERRPVSIPAALVRPAAVASDTFHRLFLRQSNPVLSTYTYHVSTHHLQFSANKARQEIGYRQQVSLEDGIAATIRWYQNNFL